MFRWVLGGSGSEGINGMYVWCIDMGWHESIDVSPMMLRNWEQACKMDVPNLEKKARSEVVNGHVTRYMGLSV